MRKFCLKIHRWLALPLGVVMTVLCFSGLALLLFKDLAPLFDMNAKEIPLYTDIVRLHRWLFMKPENAHDGGLSLGRILTAVTSMCMVLVLLSGVVVWWPKSKKALSTNSQHQQRFSQICLRLTCVVRYLCIHLPFPHGTDWSCILLRLVQTGNV